MITIKRFIFNPFQENTYVVFDETGQSVVIDPGCHIPPEEDLLGDFLTANKLVVTRLLNTHTHLDHILGNRFVSSAWGLKAEFHRLEIPILQAMPAYADQMYLPYHPPEWSSEYLADGQFIPVGNSWLQVLFTPGHSPGSVSFYSPADALVISGDVLFRESIGRTDLPLGDTGQLLDSIRTRLLILPSGTNVFSGHGDPTTIGHELQYNPFLTP